MAYSNGGDDRKYSSPITAAIFGAAVATVATLLMDGRNRKKLRNKINNFLDEGQNKMDELSLELEDMKDKGKKKVARKLKETEEKLEKTGRVGRAV